LQIFSERPSDHPQDFDAEASMTGLVIGEGGLAEQSTRPIGDLGLGEVLPAPGIPDRPAHRAGERGLRL
jgi:hypothetical protein